MTFSKIKNALSRGSLMIGALALMGTVGCANEDELGATDTAGTEAVASESAAVSFNDVCNAPWVDQYHAQEWKVYGQDNYGWVKYNNWYSDYDNYGGYLRYYQRNYGLDMIFGDHGVFNIKYERYGGGNDEIHFGDHFAIKVGNWGYLYYSPQPENYGYGLKFAYEPHYDWVFYGGQYGWKVPTNYNVSIYNDYRNDYMVYCHRPYGIELSWASECRDSQYGRYYNGYYCQQGQQPPY